GLRRCAEAAPLLDHRRELARTRVRFRLVREAHAPHRGPLEVRVAARQASATVEAQVDARVAVADEGREVAALRRRERDPVLGPLAHARVCAENDVAYAPHRSFRWRLRSCEPPLHLGRLRHAHKIARPGLTVRPLAYSKRWVR